MAGEALLAACFFGSAWFSSCSCSSFLTLCFLRSWCVSAVTTRPLEGNILAIVSGGNHFPNTASIHSVRKELKFSKTTPTSSTTTTATTATTATSTLAEIRNWWRGSDDDSIAIHRISIHKSGVSSIWFADLMPTSLHFSLSSIFLLFRWDLLIDSSGIDLWLFDSGIFWRMLAHFGTFWHILAHFLRLYFLPGFNQLWLIIDWNFVYFLGIFGDFWNWINLLRILNFFLRIFKGFSGFFIEFFSELQFVVIYPMIS